IRRVALRELYDRGALEPRRRAVWLQLSRLAAGSVLPLARRWWRRARELAFAAWVWTLFVVLLAIAWPMVAVTPGRAR
ncbi:MAG: hypothetical protein GWO02_15880, partial [Gammaproteobacteria bacterium]|nr:hypothetical protein [Gammaproteobacteria bacterium]